MTGRLIKQSNGTWARIDAHETPGRGHHGGSRGWHGGGWSAAEWAEWRQGRTDEGADEWSQWRAAGDAAAADTGVWDTMS